MGKGVLFKDVFLEEKLVKKILCFIAIISFVSVSIYTIYVYNSVFIKKEVEMKQVSYSYEETYRGAGFSTTYYFIDEKGEKISFDMSVFSHKHIIKQGFEQGTLYDVYYTKSTKEIVKVEHAY